MLKFECEKEPAIRASVGGMSGVLAWVAFVECLRGWRVWVSDAGGVLVWVAS